MYILQAINFNLIAIMYHMYLQKNNKLLEIMYYNINYAK